LRFLSTQSAVEIDIKIALPPLRLVELVLQRLARATQPRELAAQRLDLVEQIDQRTTAHLPFELSDTLFEQPSLLGNLVAKQNDLLSCLAIAEDR
jgi:hypothetical protein